MGERLRNTRHERFAREVAALTPLATAYREAGFGGDPRWHPFNASKLANKPRVGARINELRLEFEKMSAIHVDYVRHKLLKIVEADPRDLYEPDPTDPTGKRRKLRSISDLPRHLTGAIARLKIDPETGEPVDIVFAGKNEAAATLLRSLPGGSTEKHEHEINIAARFAAAEARDKRHMDGLRQAAGENSIDSDAAERSGTGRGANESQRS